MRLALIADIHGNLVSLNAVLDELERWGPDRIICLGDVAATGPQPAGSLEAIRQLDCPVVMGNTDEWILAYRRGETEVDPSNPIEEIDAWCSTEVSTGELEFIETFEKTITLRSGNGLRMFCFHGSPRSHSDEIRATTPEAELETLLHEVDADVLVGAHTHEQLLRRHNDRLVVNPGSVGLPYERMPNGDVRNPPWAEWAAVTATDQGTGVEFHRTAVDPEAIVASARQSTMPQVETWVDGWITAS